jgi:transcriptional regulator with XRE-family HTH domain
MTQLTPNQVVAYNLWAARTLRGWTQEETAERLEPYLGERWSRVVFSAAERSIDGRRIRRFSADDVVAFAAAFDFPIAFFFRPPPPDSLKTGPLDRIASPGAAEGLTREQLSDLAPGADDDPRVTAHFEAARERARASVDKLRSLDPSPPPTNRKDHR